MHDMWLMPRRVHCRVPMGYLDRCVSRFMEELSGTLRPLRIVTASSRRGCCRGNAWIWKAIPSPSCCCRTSYKGVTAGEFEVAVDVLVSKFVFVVDHNVSRRERRAEQPARVDWDRGQANCWGYFVLLHVKLFLFTRILQCWTRYQTEWRR